MKFRSICSIVGALLAFASTSAFADSFSFTYDFASTDTHLIGTFTGNQNDIFVDNISDLSVSLDGSPILATFQTFRRDDTGSWVTGPVVSFDFTQNNFAFADWDLSDGSAGYNYLFLINPDFVHFNSPDVFADDLTPDNGTWTLTNLSTPAAVPDGGVTAAMFLLALAGLPFLRRQSAV